MTTIALLGSGRVAAALAPKLAAAGHTLTIGSRSAAATSARWTGPAARFTPYAEAVRAADVVVNATPGESSLERLSALQGELRGKILVDVSNAARRDGDGLPGGLCYPNSSLAEHLQAALPDTAVVKTLNTVFYSVMADPRSLKTPPTAFLSGDDPAAKATVQGLLGDLGWPLEWTLDLGGVATARGPEAMVAVVPDVMRSQGFLPFALTVAR